MGFRNPFRIGVDPKTDTLYVADYGPDAGAANPNRGPEGTGRVEHRHQPGNYGWPYCTGDNKAYNDYTFPSGPSGREVRLRRAGEQLAQQHRPDQPAAGHRGHRRLRLRRRPALPRDRRRRRPDGRPGLPVRRRPHVRAASGRRTTTARRCSASGTRTRCTRCRSARTASRWSTSTSCSPACRMIRPMDFEFGPDGALYLIEWGTGFGGNNDDSGVYRIDYIAGDRAPIAEASADPTSGAGAADRARSPAPAPGTRTAARSPTPGRSATGRPPPRRTRPTRTPRPATTPPSSP